MCPTENLKTRELDMESRDGEKWDYGQGSLGQVLQLRVELNSDSKESWEGCVTAFQALIFMWTSCVLVKTQILI